MVLKNFEQYMRQSILDWTKKILRKTALKKVEEIWFA